MFRRSTVLFVAVLHIAVAADSRLSVAQSEQALAKALNTQDKILLTALTDEHFSLQWTDNWNERQTTVKKDRDNWVQDLNERRPGSYDAVISRVKLINDSRATVTLHDSWTLLSPVVEKHFLTIDIWVKGEAAWKLAFRWSMPDVPLKFP